MIYPNNFEAKLGFQKIRAMLSAFTLCPLGAARVDSMQFLTDRQALVHQLSLLDEMKHLVEEAAQPLPTDGFYDLSGALKRLRVPGTFIEVDDLFDLLRSLRAIDALVHYLNPAEGEGVRLSQVVQGTASSESFQQRFPLLRALAQDVNAFPDVIRLLDRTLTPDGAIRDNASPALAAIRQEMQRSLSSIGRLLDSILRSAQAEGYIDRDATPTLRDGRLVLPIPPSSKRKIRGIVHDESATGKTLYVEPAEVIEANNRIRELEGEERQEIIRILTAIADAIRPEVDDLLASYDFLGEIDFLQAKVRLAREIDGIVPRLSERNVTDWVQARHPLLFLRYRQEGKDVVPLDIMLDHGKQRIVLISGPNAGGKSVCLETLGLVQYMLQHGLPVPMRDNSEVAVFDHIFVDIGDEQSIDNDLSTYSSHLQNMKFMIRNASGPHPGRGQQPPSGGTLVLIDEFGSGTEPQIGGAIAQAILARLNSQQVNGVITTHYTNLKLFADETPGIVNGAMLYDRGAMRPLFRLEVGRPGSSFALEIAHKIGLPREVIDAAKQIVGSDYVNMDKYLQDISRDKRYWEQKRQRVHQQEKELETKSQEVAEQEQQLKARRQEVMQQARREATELMQQANARIERTIREIKEANAEREATRRIRGEHERFKEKRLSTPVEVEPSADSARPEAEPSGTAAEASAGEAGPLQPGDSVRLKGQQTVGEVLAVNGRQVQVAFGMIKSMIDRSRLERVSRNQLKREQGSTNGIGSLMHDSATPVEVLQGRRATFRQQLDVRGMRADEALQAVMYYMDDAILLSVGQVRILHGTGTGALRQAIRQYLATLPGVRDFHDEHVQFGGAGITVVELDN